MRILVTGGAGFIGCNFVRHLRAEDPEAKVVNFDLPTYAGSLSNLHGLPSDDQYTFVRREVADSGLVARLLGAHEIDTVIDIPAESHVDRSTVPLRLSERT